MRRLLTILAFMATCAETRPLLAITLPCCDAHEVQVLGDINFDARAALNHTGPLKERLYTLAMHLKAGTWSQWSDPDRGYILGLMAATNDYKLDAGNRAIVDAFAALINVTIQQGVVFPPPSVVVVPSTPPVVVSPPTVPTAVVPTTGVIEAEIRRIVQEELAKLPTASTVSAAGTSVIDRGNGELLFTGKDTGGARQDNIRGDFKASLGINNFDSGFRLLVNWGCVIPQLPFWTIGGDSHGGFSYNGAPCPKGTWSDDKTYGQALVIDGGWSQHGYDYTTRAPLPDAILIASQRGGMDILFAVTPWRKVGDPALNLTVMQLKSDGSADPVRIVIGGQMRTLKACGNTVCF